MEDYRKWLRCIALNCVSYGANCWFHFKREIIYKVNCSVTSQPPVLFHVVQSKCEQMDRKNIWQREAGSMLLTVLTDFLWCAHKIIGDWKGSPSLKWIFADAVREQTNYCSPPCQIQEGLKCLSKTVVIITFCTMYILKMSHTAMQFSSFTFTLMSKTTML